MTTEMPDYRARVHPGRKWAIVFAVTMVPVIVVGVIAVTIVLRDPDLSAPGRLGLVAVAGVGLLVLPVLVLSMHVAVRVRGADLRVQMWPLPAIRIALDQIGRVEVVALEPLGQFQGLGFKGTREDRLLGFEGDTAIRVDYVVGRQGSGAEACTDGGGRRRLTVLTPRAEEIARHLKTRVRPHG